MQLNEYFEYEVAISFAGEQRGAAEAIAKLLKAAGVTVFYDRDEKADLWGKDLYLHLSEIYQRRAQYCILLASREYGQKVWTNHERQSAQARALSEKGKEYILPVRMDDTEIPGLPASVGFLDFRREGAEGVANAFLEKTKKRLATESAYVRSARAKVASAQGKVTVEEGAIVRVFIESTSLPPEDFAESRKPGLNVKALIDTGASVTIVNPELARSCGLILTGTAKIASVSGQIGVPEYAAAISFPGTTLPRLDMVRVLAVPIGAQRVSCLIGRNVLQEWRITYDGRAGEIEIE